jgi:hypothetical protein
MVFVAGQPALLLSRGEAEWREAVRGCGLTRLRSPRFRFVVTSWSRGGNNLFDLDNLVDPVLGVVGARPSDRTSPWAPVEADSEAGVDITEGKPPPTPTSEVTVRLASAPQRAIRTTERLAELVEHAPLGVDEPCGYSLTLGADTAGVEFGFEGPIKPTIGALWPLLGGVAYAPADHRIRDLRVSRDASQTGVLVAVWSIKAA